MSKKDAPPRVATADGAQERNSTGVLAPAARVSNRQVALSLAERGLPVFPCAQDKRPLTQHGFKDATTDHDQIHRWWREHRQALVGLPTGTTSGVYVVDLDVDDATGELPGAARLEELGLGHLLADPAQPRVRTLSGGLHLYFRHPGPDFRCTTGKLGAGIDTRGDGGYVIAPGSRTFTGGYVVETEIDWANLPELPAQIRRALEEREIQQAPASPVLIIGDREFEGASFEHLSELVWSIPADCDYDDWLRVLQGIHHHTGGSAAGLALAEEWSRSGGEKYRPGEVPVKWRSFKRSGVTIATIAAIARKYGADLAAIARKHRRPPQRAATGSGRAQGSPQAVAGSRGDGGDWSSRLQLTKNGSPIANLANVMTAMREAEELRSCFAYDGMLLSIIVRQPPPGTGDQWSGPRSLCERDVLAVQEFLQWSGISRVSKETVSDAILMRAHECAYHPVRDAFAATPWDGVPRLDRMLATYFQAEDTVYTRTIGPKFMIGAVARIVKPGCKMDYMLVLEGFQGCGKSSACRILGGDYFSDALPDIRASGKDVSQHLRGKMLIEVAELASMNRTESAALKAFLTRCEEVYRPPFGRIEIVEPRQCVFIGTTNQSAYLRDETGGRRFWPVRVGTIDLEGLARDRDQLFAEAYHRFQQGEPWWPDAAFEAEHAAPEQEARYEADPWEDPIAAWLEARPGLRDLTIPQVADAALQLTPRDLGTATQRRIASCLERLGWARGSRNHSGRRVWVRRASTF